VTCRSIVRSLPRGMSRQNPGDRIRARVADRSLLLRMVGLAPGGNETGKYACGAAGSENRFPLVRFEPVGLVWSEAFEHPYLSPIVTALARENEISRARG